MICIVQARLSSKRLPGKVIKNIFNIPILLFLIKRLKKAKNISDIIVATSNTKDDEKIINLCKKNKIKFFKGHLLNVASRYENILKKKKIKCFLRISADSPLIDPYLVDKMINVSKKKKFDLFTNVFPKTFPSGQSIEIVKSNLIFKKIKNFTKDEKEHVTLHFYKNWKKYNIINFKNKVNLSKYKMSIDTLADYKKIKKISANFSLNQLLNIRLIKLLKFYK